MTDTLKAVLIFLLVTSVAAPVLADPLKYAVIIGNNAGTDKTRTLRYAEGDARKLYDTLVSAGGFAPADISLLLGKSAGVITAVLSDIEKRAAEKRRQTGRKTLLVLYYSGHAEGDVLELGSSSLSFSKLRAFLDKSSFDVRIAFIDSCMSGQLIQTKGGAPGPSFDIKVTDQIQSTGYAIITSSAGNELSQESRTLRGSYFTHFLVSALRGSADTSKDGQISLQEVYRYAYTRTVSLTTTTIGGAQHPMYHFQLEGQGDVILTRPGNFSARIQVMLQKPARLLMLDGVGDTILAEASISGGRLFELPVPPGNYRIYLLHADGKVSEKTMAVQNKEVRRISEGDFRVASLDRTVSKGGLFRVPEKTISHRLSVGGLFRRWPLEGGTASWGAAALYRLTVNSRIQPVVRFTWTTAPDAGVSTGYFDLGLSGGIGWIKPIAGMVIRLEALAGYEHLFQDPAGGSARHTSGFSWLGSAGVEVPIGSSVVVAVDAGAGGRVFQVIDKGWVHRFDAQGILSVGYRWGEE